MGMFSGRRPGNLGVKDGKLARHNARPNNVHSQIASEDSHYIAPIKPAKQPAAAFKKLVEIVCALPRTNVVNATDDYLYVETSSPTMGFVDDNEFYFDKKANLIHVRAAARLGIRDFDANRKRVELVRQRLGEAGF